MAKATSSSVVITKDALISAVQAKTKTQLTKAELGTITDGILEVIGESLVNGSDVLLKGVGSLRVRTAAERNARNVRTGEAIVVPARREVKFSVSEDLKKRVAPLMAA